MRWARSSNSLAVNSTTEPPQAHLVGGDVDFQIAGTEAGRLGRGRSTAPLARRRTAFTRAVSSRGENGLAT